jgi:hypothetical protein
VIVSREGHTPPQEEPPAPPSHGRDSSHGHGSAALAWLTCFGFYAVYKLAGGPLPWWPAWVALGLGAAAAMVEALLRRPR